MKKIKCLYFNLNISAHIFFLNLPDVDNVAKKNDSCWQMLN